MEEKLPLNSFSPLHAHRPTIFQMFPSRRKQSDLYKSNTGRTTWMDEWGGGRVNV